LRRYGFRRYVDEEEEGRQAEYPFLLAYMMISEFMLNGVCGRRVPLVRR
jgi:hypothetical protein